MRAHTFLLAAFEVATVFGDFRRGGNSAGDALRVSTTSGRIHGKIDPELPHVRQFLGIPYAQPPIEDLRWQPPRPVSQPDAKIDATSLPPSCIQYFSTAIPNMSNQEILQFNVQAINGTPTAISEDCLTLSIWTPTRSQRSRPQRGSSGCEETPLPVLVFIYGGGFGTGGTVVPYQIPAQWVERSSDHLFVSFNYRLNIFGFPNAAGLEQQNLGLLDQRLAIEWLKANVAAFGGDPERMVIWGQSAGGMSVDYYTFTYPDDPIVSGLIMDSGTAQTPFTSTDLEHTNFTFVADNVGCEGFGGDPAGELACMREVDARKINDFIAGYQGFEKTPGIAFVPVIDEEVVFANYSARALDGKQAKIPAIICTNREDGVPFANYRPYSPTGDFDQSLNELYYLSLFFCPQTETTLRRQQTGLKTFVYQYSGNFSNVSPKPWMGAYHSAELPMLMGTHPNFRGKSSGLEKATSRAMQDAWVAFAREGASGLERLGWREYESLGDADVREFGAGVAAKDVSVADVEARCNGPAPAM